MYKLVSGIFLIFSLTACSEAMRNTPGTTAYYSGDYPAALETLKQEYDAGEAVAGYALGQMYLQGQGVKQDIMLAEWYLLAAAMIGHARAIEALEQLYRDYPSCEKDGDLQKIWSGLGEHSDYAGEKVKVNWLNPETQLYLYAIYMDACGNRPANPHVAQQWLEWAFTPRYRNINVFD